MATRQREKFASKKTTGLDARAHRGLDCHRGRCRKQDCLEAGMDDFLSKPCTLEELSRVVSRWSPSQVMPPALPQDELPGDAPVREASQGATAQA